MGYGARARRKPALGGAMLTDVDISKVLLLGKTERGIVDANGHPVVMDEIYSMSDFYPKCGGFNSSYYAAYVAQSFFDELESSNSCEMKVLSYVDVSAAQATYSIMDSAGSPVKIFDIKSGRRGLNDLSAFGNKTAIKLSQVEDITMKLTADVATGATYAYLDSIDNLLVGQYIKFTGHITTMAVITAIVPATKRVEFAAMTVAPVSGYAEITNVDTLGTFASATVPALASATYDIDITVDGGSVSKLAVALLNSDSWSGIATKIQTALRTATSSTETVTITSGKIRVTSATTGPSSTILIAAGTTGSAGGDLLAVINAVTGYTCSLDTPVAGATDLTVAQTTVKRQDIKLEIAVKDSLGNYQKEEEWEFPFAKSNTIGLASFVNDVDSGSDYVVLAVNSANSSPAISQMPVELTSWTPLAGGSDGIAAVDANWNTLAETYLPSTEFTIMMAPESSSITHNSNMLDFCTDNYRGMYYAQAANGATEDTLKNFGASLRGSIKFGMLPSDKWIRVDDPTVIGGYKEIPKVGIDAAFWFNTYANFGEAKVAAGNKSEMVLKTSGTLLDSNGLVHDDTNGVGGRLIRNYSINICRYRRGKGITNNSARTFSTDDGYKYQHQVMMFLLYSRSIVAYLREIEQDKAGADAQMAHYNAVWSYMRKKYDAGQLYVGRREDGSFTTFEDVCIIINDFSINTIANINNGIEEIFLQFVAPGVIEEPILSLASAGVTTVKS
jgi:hypothetical protein